METEKNAGVNPPNTNTLRPKPPGGSQPRTPWSGLTRKQQLESEDVQRALEMLWCVTPVRICSNDTLEWKQLTEGVLLCRGLSPSLPWDCGKFYLYGRVCA